MKTGNLTKRLLPWQRTHDSSVLAAAFVLLYAVILVRTAWITDDAAITLRTVLNTLNGLGATFNPDERVQAYTHPLWFLLLVGSGWVVGNVFAATFILSVGVSLLTVALLLRASPGGPARVACLGLAVCLSKAFVDFSTSGLENPLSHALILAAWMIAAHCQTGHDLRGVRLLLLVCSGLYLTRPDLVLLVLPLACWVVLPFVRQPGRLMAASLLGVLPLLLWTVFALVYYGFPFPNTAYAKLSTGIPLIERLIQGLKYLLVTARYDPITAFVIALGAGVGVFGPAPIRCLTAGLLLYLLYLVSVGGDFMAGRFLTVPFLTALIILAYGIRLERRWPLLAAPILLLGAGNVQANLLSGASYGVRDEIRYGVMDERGFYYPKFGWLTGESLGHFRQPSWQIEDRSVEVLCGGLGFNGIVSGPGVHFIDDCALADPLLARLPSQAMRYWRVGHFHRLLPANYQVSLEQGRNLLSDPPTRAYWEALRILTRDPVFSADRLATLLAFHLGRIELPDTALYRRGFPEADGPYPAFDLHTWDREHGDRVPQSFDTAIDVALGSTRSLSEIELQLGGAGLYTVYGEHRGRWMPLGAFTVEPGASSTPHRMRFDIPVQAVDRIRVTAQGSDARRALQHLSVSSP